MRVHRINPVHLVPVYQAGMESLWGFPFQGGLFFLAVSMLLIKLTLNCRKQFQYGVDKRFVKVEVLGNYGYDGI